MVVWSAFSADVLKVTELGLPFVDLVQNVAVDCGWMVNEGAELTVKLKILLAIVLTHPSVAKIWYLPWLWFWLSRWILRVYQ